MMGFAGTSRFLPEQNPVEAAVPPNQTLTMTFVTSKTGKLIRQKNLPDLSDVSGRSEAN